MNTIKNFDELLAHLKENNVKKARGRCLGRR